MQRVYVISRVTTTNEAHDAPAEEEEDGDHRSI